MKLGQCTVLVTGAAGGIASAIASELQAGGARLLLTDLNSDALVAVEERFDLPGDRLCTFAGDITDPFDRSRLVALAGDFGVNVLINAAGLNPFGPLDEQSTSQIELALRVNLLAPILLCQEMLPVLRRGPQGRIVNIGSSFGAIGFPCFSTYSATKFGMHGFSEALRRELAGSSVKVHYVAPRATRTRLVTDRIKAMNEELGVGMDTPEDVARAVARVIESESRECTLGLPERIYAKLNGLLPGVIDRALAKQLPTILRYASNRTDTHIPNDNAPAGAMETHS